MTERMQIAEYREAVEAGRLQPEDWHQARLVEALDTWPDPVLRAELAHLYHVPNGGARPKGTAGWLRAQGVRYGIPDLIHARPRGGFAGLGLELKSWSGSPTSDQRARLEALAAWGHLAVCARGWTRALEVIRWYVAQPPSVALRPGGPPYVYGFASSTWAARWEDWTGGAGP